MFLLQIASGIKADTAVILTHIVSRSLDLIWQLVWTFLGSLAHSVPARPGPHLAGMLLLQDMLLACGQEQFSPGGMWAALRSNPRRARSLWPLC